MPISTPLCFRSLQTLNSNTKIVKYIYYLNVYKNGNIHIIWHWGIFRKPLMHWNRNKNYIFWVCVCSLWYLACKYHAPSCHWCLFGSTIYFTLCHKWHDSQYNRLLNKKCVFWFSLQIFGWNIFHSKKKWVRYDQKWILVVM